MALSKVYSGDQILLVVGGKQISGFADGEALLIEMLSPVAMSVVGTDGEVAVSRNADERGSITVKLMQTSDDNDYFSGLVSLMRQSPGFAGVTSIYVRDMNGRSLHEAEHGWIAELPSVSYDRSATSREWKFECAVLKNFVGGNTLLGG